MPIPFWLPLELWRWVYWQLVAAPRQIQSAILRKGPETESLHGIMRDEQRRIISFWAKSWTISPEYAYDLGLFRADADALNMILTAEMQPYHRLINEQLGASKADYRMLFDKSLLADYLAAKGVEVVSGIQESDGEMEDLRRAVASNGPVFCKLRAGSRGESAFMAELGVTGLIGRTLTGEKLDSETAVAAAWKFLTQKGPVLIQPYLKNHPLLQGVSPGSKSMTLRVITRMQGKAPAVWAGLLYVQADGNSMERGCWMLKVDAGTGQVYDAFGHWYGPELEINDAMPLLMLNGQAIPFWLDIASQSERAHAEQPRFWSIAWDWIVTPEGAALLEGNAGWDLTPMQELGVDFVKIGCEMTGN